MTDIWTEALRGLRPLLGTETYDLWLRPLELLEADDERVRLRAPSQFMKEWFENHYKEAVLEQMRRVLRSPAMVAGVSERAVRLDPSLDEAQVTVSMNRQGSYPGYMFGPSGRSAALL